jgi:hypothetical protein
MNGLKLLIHISSGTIYESPNRHLLFTNVKMEQVFKGHEVMPEDLVLNNQGDILL